jgi:hydroxymethylpyrimidine pyrophosphatase-like HAD family hydrolase
MIQNRFEFDNKSICSILRRHPNAYQITLETIEQQIKDLEEVFGLTEKESIGMFYDYTQAFLTPKPLMQEYNQMINLCFDFPSKQEYISFIKDYCFLMTIETNRSSAVLFELTRQKISKETIFYIIKKIPFFLYGKKGNLKHVLNKLRSMDISRKELEKLLIANPYIVSLDFHKMLMHKITILKQMEIEEKDIGRIFKLFPTLVTKSIFSTSVKISYLTKNFSEIIRIEPYFPYILCFDFNKYIKPRGKI